MDSAITWTAGRETGARGVIAVDRLADLEAIFDPAISLVVWHRPASDCERRARGWQFTRERTLRTTVPPECDAALVAERLELDRQPETAADITMLAELFATLTDARALGLRLELATRATCPRLHADRLSLRLMTTYLGPGTEWLADGKIHRAATGDVLLAKGTAWPELPNGPSLHRSPTLAPGEKRVLLTVDAL